MEDEEASENAISTLSSIATSSLLQIHWTGIPHVDELESLGCLLFYEVDVHKMHTHPTLKNMKFDIIIFNFPHAGHYPHLRDRDLGLIEMHKELVEAYFKSASMMLTKGGEVHMTHREDSPYDSWNIVLLAAKAGLSLKDKVDFNKSDYPGYHNKRGGGVNTNKSFSIMLMYRRFQKKKWKI
ncbi:heavy metal-associated isoprenylated plant protein 41-like [Bidens hawaiensis]|uniref:heavy metal-associated isoprenylated plant protein 41-like n=1 Tax=Bidens hawaiensis TaxID=980011 RepID=UPI00404A1C60